MPKKPWFIKILCYGMIIGSIALIVVMLSSGFYSELFISPAESRWWWVLINPTPEAIDHGTLWMWVLAVFPVVTAILGVLGLGRCSLGASSPLVS
ncbi:MAG: hypothetical protein V1807_02650 [Patescibacteria group bacterium]